MTKSSWAGKELLIIEANLTGGKLWAKLWDCLDSYIQHKSNWCCLLVHSAWFGGVMNICALEKFVLVASNFSTFPHWEAKGIREMYNILFEGEWMLHCCVDSSSLLVTSRHLRGCPGCLATVECEVTGAVCVYVCMCVRTSIYFLQLAVSLTATVEPMEQWVRDHPFDYKVH